MNSQINRIIPGLFRSIKNGTKPIHITGITGSARSYLFSQILEALQKPCLSIVPKQREAEELFKQLKFFMSDVNGQPDNTNMRLCEFPPYDISPLTGISPYKELVVRRLQALYMLLTHEHAIVVTSLEAIAFRLLPKKAFVGALEYLEVGEDFDRDDLLRKLEINGYQRASITEEVGEYSVRGGVMDVFPPFYSLPIRLEFWGDRLESLRFFNPLSQRSQTNLQEATLLPASEIIMDEENIRKARSMGRLPKWKGNDLNFPGKEAWLNHFYSQLNTIFHYLPHNSCIALFDPTHMESTFKYIKQRYDRGVRSSRKESAEKGMPFPEVENILIPTGEIYKNLNAHQCFTFSELDYGETDASQKIVRLKGPFEQPEELSLKLRNTGRISMAPLADKVSQWLASQSRIVLVSRTEKQAMRFLEILEDYHLKAELVQQWSEISRRHGLYVCVGTLSKGFIWPDLGLYVISEDEIFGAKRTRSGRRKSISNGTQTWSSLSQLEKGDLVVHEEHGIGCYGGLTTLEINHKVNDFVIIEYAHKDRLYLPADRISVLQKYAGMNDRNPKLDQLGGHTWQLTKLKAQNSVRKIAKQLVEMYALRNYRKGYAFSPPDIHFREFEATFEHEETPDQVKAIEDVLEDMTSDRPMDRLICGDVGFGKTEIALRATFKAISDGKQVALLVPTTVLAEQHYETFKKRMAKFSIRVGILSRFKTKTEQMKTLTNLRSGKIDIMIGTHRMLQKDVRFRDLGLLIIDEEQRFGVKQKEILKKYRSLVDVLAISATPIPRTLQMSMMGVRDLSIIETPPEDRHAVQTYLSPYDESVIVHGIKSELERNGQVFFVHNKIKSIESMGNQLKKLVPRARFAVAHGRMKEKELERTMMGFLNKDIDVLVCTTIIESGLDIPSANTIIINKVDHLGLSQIYQLRGRVGRSREKAFAYLLVSNKADLTRDAEKRLKALMDFSQLGAGLHLAMHDLQIRGAGNILGFAQAGHISAVGYELYMKLIERSIAELKGEEWNEDINPEINIDITAYLPADYMIDTGIRLNFYRRLSTLQEKKELFEIKEEIRDRFGPSPQEVQNLFQLMSIRLNLKSMGINRLDVGKNSITMTFSQHSKLHPNDMVRLMEKEPKKYQLLSGDKLKLNVVDINLPDNLKKIEQVVESLKES